MEVPYSNIIYSLVKESEPIDHTQESYGSQGSDDEEDQSDYELDISNIEHTAHVKPADIRGSTNLRALHSIGGGSSSGMALLERLAIAVEQNTAAMQEIKASMSRISEDVDMIKSKVFDSTQEPKYVAYKSENRYTLFYGRPFEFCTPSIIPQSYAICRAYDTTRG
ncbi:UNVERIFIED_CONTAM: hypothetical protein HDU68_009359 [Siphonaria sp. JEL0065]|nr:hypothetical protein HDU68_009359 [Siphonaria sp. JEL0065]